MLLSVVGGGALAFFIALRTFWWCPEGGCSLRTSGAVIHALANVLGWTVLFLCLSIALWFLSIAVLARPWYPRTIAEQTYLPSITVLPQWYSRPMGAWIDWLWSKDRAGG